jgi:glucokinase
MASSRETVGEAIGSTVLAADIGGTNARFQVLFIKAFRITRTHIFIYYVDMEP